MFKKYRPTIAIIALTLFIFYAGGFFDTFAWFIRTWWLGILTPASNPNTIKYGYGLWDNGWWWGTGYGYISGEITDNTNSRYASGTQKNVGVTLSWWSTTTTWSFTWYNNIHIEIPVGTIITPVEGGLWDGLIHIPTTGAYNMIDSSTVQWVVKLEFLFIGWAVFSKPVEIVIPVSGIPSAKVRADHWAWLTTLGLTRVATATCTSGVASAPYDGTEISVIHNTITIYTCAASTFVAYTPYTPPSWWGGWWGWGGGWGWTPAPTKDICPNGDKSWNAYDGSCNDTNKDGEKAKKVKTIISLWNIANNLLSGTTPVDPAYSQEYNDAYQFAFTKGITTKPSIKEANMTWVLTRAAMAKMMVNYAINVLGKILDTWVACGFSDMAGQSAETQEFATKACQLWLMGKEQTKFSPKDLVTRGQLWTVLSRMIYATPDSGAPYYTIHLTTLKDKWVLTNIDATRVEKRVYLMLILMRAAK